MSLFCLYHYDLHYSSQCLIIVKQAIIIWPRKLIWELRHHLGHLFDHFYRYPPSPIPRLLVNFWLQQPRDSCQECRLWVCVFLVTIGGQDAPASHLWPPTKKWRARGGKLSHNSAMWKYSSGQSVEDDGGERDKFLGGGVWLWLRLRVGRVPQHVQLGGTGMRCSGDWIYFISLILLLI